MAIRSLPRLDPTQVVAVQDALLANADRLLLAATSLLDSNVPLARSLAILALEESGKAIALHDRRVAMAFADEGAPFVTEELEQLWGSHEKKLALVHAFLVEERYWFGTAPSDPEENARALGAIRSWSRRHDRAKQRGFYVDLDRIGNVLDPMAAADEGALEDVIFRVHQIGWQLRLGEHIEAKKQGEQQRGVPAADDTRIQALRDRFSDDTRFDPEILRSVEDSMRQGTPAQNLRNAEYRLSSPSNPFENIGRPGYEAETREVTRLRAELEADDTPTPPISN